MNKSHFNIKSLGDHYIVSDGLLTNQKFILFIGRSNTARNSMPLEKLFDNLKAQNYIFIWLQPKGQVTSLMLDEKSKNILGIVSSLLGQKDSRIFRHLSRLIKKFILLMHPLHWGYFLRHYRALPSPSLSANISRYRNLIHSLGGNKEIVIIAHSAGGRIATSLETENCIKKIICFGYPFKHPQDNEEDQRTAHLEHLTKPCLIIQGKYDEYGGEEVMSRYKLSQNISFQFIDANHEYEDIDLEQWKSATKAIESLLAESSDEYCQ